MKRTGLLGIAALSLVAGTAVALASETPAAALITCQGREATIVGDGQNRLAGTDGDDVIVTNAALRTDAGDGDDVICITGAAKADVDAGGGTDSITVDDAAYLGSFIVPGDGDDTVVGGPGADFVGRDNQIRGPDDGGDDTISTGAGPDTVILELGGARTVDLGTGDDVVSVRGVTSTSTTIEGGAGQDVMEVSPYSRGFSGVSFDLRRQTIANREQRLVSGWNGMEAYRLSPRATGPSDSATFDGPVEVIGTDGADDVVVLGSSTVSLRLGGGRDRAALDVGDGRVDGGAGVDTILAARFGSVAGVDLRRGFLTSLDQGRTVDTARLVGFENAALSGYQLPGVRLVGDGGPNVLVSACGRISGGDGDDAIRSAAFDLRSSRPFVELARATLCGKKRFVAEGNPGDDVLGGTAGNDVLLGGNGRDRATGHAGRDRCLAEVVRSCEVRR